MSEIIRSDPAFQAIAEETTASLRAWLGGPSFKVIYKASCYHSRPSNWLCVHLDVCRLLWPNDFSIVAQLADLHVFILLQLFVSLGLWPEGIWREQPSINHKQRCKGSMHKVRPDTVVAEALLVC